MRRTPRVSIKSTRLAYENVQPGPLHTNMASPSALQSACRLGVQFIGPAPRLVRPPARVRHTDRTAAVQAPGCTPRLSTKSVDNFVHNLDRKLPTALSSLPGPN